MSTIQQYIGEDPNGTNTKMSKVVVDKPGYLGIANLPANDDYIFHFWIKANGVFSCNVKKETSSILDFNTSTSWQEKSLKIQNANAGEDIHIYLPIGTYYFWHTKLERGEYNTDYSRSQYDFENLINENSALIESLSNSVSEINNQGLSVINGQLCMTYYVQ